MQTIDLLAIDLDATLASDVTPADLSAHVQLLQNAGIDVALASSRTLTDLRRQFPARGLSYICDNGGLVYSNGRIIAHNMLDTRVQRLMCGFIARQLDAIPVAIGIDAAYIGTEHAQFAPAIAAAFTNLRMVPNLAQLPVPADRITAYFPHGDSLAHVAAVHGKFALDYTVTVRGGHWIDLMNTNVNQGTALDCLREHLGISVANTVAIGSTTQSKELLSSAQHRYTVLDGSPINNSIDFNPDINQNILNIMKNIAHGKMRKVS